MSDSDSGDDAYGPPLPPGMKTGNSSSQNHDEGEDEDSFMPALPPHLRKPSSKETASKDNEKDDSCMPSLPPSLQKKAADNNEEDDEGSADEDDMYGPALPPHLLQKKMGNKETSQEQKRVVGPSLPVGYVPPVAAIPAPKEEESSESEDDFVVGPAPATGKIDHEEYRIRQFEYRAKKMKDKLEGKSEDKPMQRESWMLELPEDRKSFCGLEARQFRRKEPLERGDRSVWTDTPADKERKARMAEEDEEECTPEDVAAKKRDAELSSMVEGYNAKKRAEPLIDMHLKKKKKQEANAGPKERRPFSREEDLNVNKFDDAQKEVILKKARNLNDRFSAGNKKFL